MPEKGLVAVGKKSLFPRSDLTRIFDPATASIIERELVSSVMAQPAAAG